LKKVKLTADSLQNLAIFLVLFIIFVIGTIVEPDNFLTGSNISNMMVAASSIIIVASAVTMVLISGNLDLSVGGIGAMSAVLFGLMTKHGVAVPFAIVITVLLGALIGFLTGFIITKFLLPSFLISLAFDYIARGIALIGAHGAVVFDLPNEVTLIGKTINGIPLPTVYALITVIVFIWIQNKTVFAAQAYSIGANEKAAQYSGISRLKVVTIIFTITGALCAFVGVVITSRFFAADSGILKSLGNDCIIAAVLGGTDINGGRGTVLGMLIGAFVVTALTNIMNMQGITIYTQDVVRGIVLILAILMNNVIRSKVKI